MKPPRPNSVIFRYKWDVLVLLLLMPLAVINLNGFHDVGDDFAQYLLQARWLTGDHQAWFPSHAGSYSPGVKGWLFSVLLMPANLGTFPADIIMSKLIVTGFLVLAGWIFFRILHNFLPTVAALGCTLFLVYNPMMLDLKNQILPDIPMMATFLMVFYLLFFQKSTSILLVITTLVIWFSAGLKTPGLLLIIPVIGWVFTTTFIGRYKFLFASLTGMLVIPAIEFVLAETNNGPVWYWQQTIEIISPVTLVKNATIYSDSLQLIPQLELPMWINYGMLILLSIGWLLGLVFSFFPESGSHRNLKSKYFERVMLVFQLAYVLMLLVYPYLGDPVRMLLPIFPFLLITTFKGYVTFSQRINFSPYKTGAVLAGLALPVLMIPSMLKLTSKNLEARKEYRANLNMAQFLKLATQPTEVLKSNKPWAVQYYAERITLPETDSLKVNRIVLSISPQIPEARNLSDKQIVFQNDFWRVYEVKH
jgi:hypothetical protein